MNRFSLHRFWALFIVVGLAMTSTAGNRLWEMVSPPLAIAMTSTPGDHHSQEPAVGNGVVSPSDDRDQRNQGLVAGNGAASFSRSHALRPVNPQEKDSPVALDLKNQLLGERSLKRGPAPATAAAGLEEWEGKRDKLTFLLADMLKSGSEASGAEGFSYLEKLRKRVKRYRYIYTRSLVDERRLRIDDPIRLQFDHALIDFLYVLTGSQDVEEVERWLNRSEVEPLGLDIEVRVRMAATALVLRRFDETPMPQTYSAFILGVERELFPFLAEGLAGHPEVNVTTDMTNRALPGIIDRVAEVIGYDKFETTAGLEEPKVVYLEGKHLPRVAVVAGDFFEAEASRRAATGLTPSPGEPWDEETFRKYGASRSHILLVAEEKGGISGFMVGEIIRDSETRQGAIGVAIVNHGIWPKLQGPVEAVLSPLEEKMLEFLFQEIKQRHGGWWTKVEGRWKMVSSPPYLLVRASDSRLLQTLQGKGYTADSVSLKEHFQDPSEDGYRIVPRAANASEEMHPSHALEETLQAYLERLIRWGWQRANQEGNVLVRVSVGDAAQLGEETLLAIEPINQAVSVTETLAGALNQAKGGIAEDPAGRWIVRVLTTSEEGEIRIAVQLSVEPQTAGLEEWELDMKRDLRQLGFGEAVERLATRDLQSLRANPDYLQLYLQALDVSIDATARDQLVRGLEPWRYLPRHFPSDIDVLLRQTLPQSATEEKFLSNLKTAEQAIEQYLSSVRPSAKEDRPHPLRYLIERSHTKGELDLLRSVARRLIVALDPDASEAEVEAEVKFLVGVTKSASMRALVERFQELGASFGESYAFSFSKAVRKILSWPFFLRAEGSDVRLVVLSTSEAGGLSHAQLAVSAAHEYSHGLIARRSLVKWNPDELESSHEDWITNAFSGIIAEQESTDPLDLGVGGSMGPTLTHWLYAKEGRRLARQPTSTWVQTLERGYATPPDMQVYVQGLVIGGIAREIGQEVMEHDPQYNPAERASRLIGVYATEAKAPVLEEFVRIARQFRREHGLTEEHPAAGLEEVRYELLSKSQLEALLQLRTEVFIPAVNPELGDDQDFLESESEEMRERLLEWIDAEKAFEGYPFFSKPDDVVAVVLATAGGKLVGYALGRLRSRNFFELPWDEISDGEGKLPIVEVAELAVEPSRRREGIGTRLTEELLNRLGQVPGIEGLVWVDESDGGLSAKALGLGFGLVDDSNPDAPIYYQALALPVVAAGLEEKEVARTRLRRFLSNADIESVIPLLIEPQTAVDLTEAFDQLEAVLKQAGYQGKAEVVPFRALSAAPLQERPTLFIQETGWADDVRANFQEAVRRGWVEWTSDFASADIVIGDETVQVSSGQVLIQVNAETAKMLTPALLTHLEKKGLLEPGSIVVLHSLYQGDLGEGLLIFA